jgi:hypothetical protein
LARRIVSRACFTLVFLLLGHAVRAADPPWDVQQAALCTSAIALAEQHRAFPPGLLGTIGKVESGRPITSMGDVRAWPWTIEADGTGLYFESKAAAVAWARQGLARGIHFMDVGCMQVNLQMHPAAFHSLEDAFDPVMNAEYAAKFLQSLYVETGGDWNVATGYYHSRTPDLAAEYRNRVAEVGAGIVTGIGGPEPLYMNALRHGTLHLALAGGGMLLINFHRQPTARTQPKKSACKVAAILDPILSRRLAVHAC